MNSHPSQGRTRPQPCMVLVMGVTGSGKSHFINTLKEGAVRESANMNSETSSCQVVRTEISDHQSVAIVDTPGFDDTHRSDADILGLITTFLTTQYQLGIPLKGIVYLHRITDNRMQGTSLRNIRMFEKLCGDQALGNVVLMTTMWDNLKNELEGLDRDQELRENWWGPMEEKGSYIARFDGSKEMAEAMVIMLLEKNSVVLDIQKELHDRKMRLSDTTAGKVMLPYVEEEADHRKLSSRVAEETGAEIEKQQKRQGWKDAIQLFATVTGIAVNVVFNLLPLLGVIGG